MMKYLLDTHVFLWWALEHPDLPKVYFEHLTRLETEAKGYAISVISFWEIAKLTSLDRLKISFSLDRWFEELERDVVLTVLPLSGMIILESMRLGQGFPKDPADQLIVATARVHKMTLLTCDERIRASRSVPVLVQ